MGPKQMVKKCLVRVTVDGLYCRGFCRNSWKDSGVSGPSKSRSKSRSPAILVGIWDVQVGVAHRRFSLVGQGLFGPKIQHVSFGILGSGLRFHHPIP